MSASETLLVTGAAGFIGARFVESCNARGVSVVSVDHRDAFASRPEHARLDFGTTLDVEELAPWLSASRFPLAGIVHMGAISSTTELDEALLRRFNVDCSKNLWNEARRLGIPYVWGGAGPTQFDCSGLVQWSMAQAGIVMPRVAADQARTGPLLPLSQLQPGDLLFYHTDPTAPSYISHVAIYIGNGQMLQAPEPGMNVEIVAADFGAGFAGAVRVEPSIAAQVAGNPAG